MWRSLGVLGWVIWPVLAVAAAGGCAAPAPAPALARVGEQTGRAVFAPLRFAWLSSQRATGDLPSALSLGGKTSGRVLLYFEFPEPDAGRPLLSAELVLTPAQPGPAIDVELSRADAARGTLRDWSDQPRALYPRLAARLEAHDWPSRLEVTEILRAQTKNQPSRLLLRAEPGEADAEGVLIATGAAGGSAPRLELYFR